MKLYKLSAKIHGSGSKGITEYPGRLMVNTTFIHTLFIDQQSSNADLLSEICTHCTDIKLSIDPVESIQKAIEILARNKHDLIFLDFRVLITEKNTDLHSFLQKVPGSGVILLVDPEDEDLAAEAVQFEPADYLIKWSFTPKLLERAVRSILEQKNNLSAAKESERAFHTLVSNLPGMVFRCLNDASWTMKFVSDGSIELTGYLPEDMIDNQKIAYSQIIHPEDSDLVWKVIEDALNKRLSYRVTYRIITAGGKQKYVWEQGRGIFSDSGELLAIEGFIMDVTQENTSRQALYENQQRLDSVINSFDDIVFTLDTEQRHTAVYGRWIEKSGMTEALFLGKTTREILGDEAARAHEEANQKALQGNNVIYEWTSGTATIQTSLSPIYDDQKKVCGLLGVGRDITERKAAEAALKENRDFTRSISDSSPTHICVLDQNGSILFVNHAWNQFAQTNGVDDLAEVGVGKDFLDALQKTSQIQKEDFEKAAEGIFKVVREELQEFYLEYACCAAKEERWFLMHVVPMIQPKMSVIITQIDTTAQKLLVSEQEAEVAMASAVRDAITLEDVVRVVADQVERTLNTSALALGLWRENQERFTLQIANGSWEGWNSLRYKPDRLGICLAAMKQGKPFVINQADEPGELIRPPFILETYNIACFPLIVGKDKIGVMWVLKSGPISDRDVRIATLLSVMAASAIHRAILYDQTLQHLENFRSLRTIDQGILAKLPRETVLQLIVDQVIANLGVHAVDILLIDESNGQLELAASSGFHHEFPNGSMFEQGGPAAFHKLAQSKSFYVENLRTIPNFITVRQLEQERFISYFAVPFSLNDLPKGILEIFQRKRLDFSSEQIEFLYGLTRQISIAMTYIDLYSGLEQKNIELIEAYDSTIEGWSRTLNLRDEETEDHTQRVTQMTMELAKRMGIDGEDLTRIRWGTLLHDIGKMGVPDSILHKPGPLSSEEWQIMRMHPVYAYERLKPIKFLQKSLEIPYCHHEKWDGSGYPRRLKGLAIPLSARVFALVDVWDALISDRPYRAAWGEDRALAYVIEQSGRHFDPAVVKVFVKLLKERNLIPPSFDFSSLPTT
jgi:PAS domain S-box-containing protein/putative nucleotidyltransferase with HDIG domain